MSKDLKKINFYNQITLKISVNCLTKKFDILITISNEFRNFLFYSILEHTTSIFFRNMSVLSNYKK